MDGRRSPARMGTVRRLAMGAGRAAPSRVIGTGGVVGVVEVDHEAGRVAAKVRALDGVQQVANRAVGLGAAGRIPEEAGRARRRRRRSNRARAHPGAGAAVPPAGGRRHGPRDCSGPRPRPRAQARPARRTAGWGHGASTRGRRTPTALRSGPVNGVCREQRVLRGTEVVQRHRRVGARGGGPHPCIHRGDPASPVQEREGHEDSVLGSHGWGDQPTAWDAAVALATIHRSHGWRMPSQTPVVLACQRCCADNPDGFRFCGSCGAAIAVDEGEIRKTVTVLFADITGSTALGERLDSESLRGVMTRFYGLARTVLERHGGTVEKFIGDAVMAVLACRRCTRRSPPRLPRRGRAPSLRRRAG